MSGIYAHVFSISFFNLKNNKSVRDHILDDFFTRVKHASLLCSLQSMTDYYVF